MVLSRLRYLINIPRLIKLMTAADVNISQRTVTGKQHLGLATTSVGRRVEKLGNFLPAYISRKLYNRSVTLRIRRLAVVPTP